jgi:hypothetical protein
MTPAEQWLLFSVALGAKADSMRDSPEADHVRLALECAATSAQKIATALLEGTSREELFSLLTKVG